MLSLSRFPSMSRWSITLGCTCVPDNCPSLLALLVLALLVQVTAKQDHDLG